jgi:hypothetical protein
MTARGDRATVAGTRMAPAMRAVLLDAAARTPTGPPGGWLWPPRGWWTRVFVVLIAAMAIGFSGGAIAQLAVNMGVSPDVATIVGLGQCAPLLLAERWPLLAWRIMTAALFVGEIVLPRLEVWPWPVTSVLAFAVVLFQVAIAHGRRTTLGVGLLSVLVVVLPATLFKDTPLWLTVILCSRARSRLRRRCRRSVRG